MATSRKSSTRAASKTSGRKSATTKARVKPSETAAARKKGPKKAATKKGATKKAVTKKAAATPVDKKVPAKKLRRVAQIKEAAGRPAAGFESSPQVQEFIAAIDAYKKAHGRLFPGWSEILHIVQSLGYRKD